MIRMWTYLTLNGAGEPTAAANYYNIEFAELDVDMSNNMNLVEDRTGIIRMIYDSTYQFPVSGKLTISMTHVNLPSLGGTVRYLGNVLYRAYGLHLPVCLFLQDDKNWGQKCYVCYFTKPDSFIAANGTVLVGERMNTLMLNPRRSFTFDVLITLDGGYTDVNDLVSTSWITR